MSVVPAVCSRGTKQNILHVGFALCSTEAAVRGEIGSFASSNKEFLSVAVIVKFQTKMLCLGRSPCSLIQRLKSIPRVLPLMCEIAETFSAIKLQFNRRPAAEIWVWHVICGYNNQTQHSKHFLILDINCLEWVCFRFWIHNLSNSLFLFVSTLLDKEKLRS